jgi:hypothetical protein
VPETNNHHIKYMTDSSKFSLSDVRKREPICFSHFGEKKSSTVPNIVQNPPKEQSKLRTLLAQLVGTLT